VSDENASLGDDETDKLVVLRMNRDFMKFGRQYYAHRLNEPFGKFGTVLTVKSNVEMGTVDIDSDRE
jgi:hypothetical protein